MIYYKVMFFLSIVVTPFVAQAAETSYYVTQNGAGQKNGLSLENAWSLENFNNSSFWSSIENAAKIDPGDTVFLYGDFNQGFIPRVGGNENAPIIIDGRNARINVNTQEVAKIFDIRNIRYLILQNLQIDGQDNTMSSSGDRAAIWIREFGSPTGNITIQDSQIQGSTTGVVLQGDVSHIYIYRNLFQSMSNSGVLVAADDYDGDGKNGYDDCPSYIVIGGSSENGNEFLNIGKLTPDEWVNYADGVKGGSVPGSTLGTTAKDLIFSYNHVQANQPNVGAGIYMNGAKRILVEYNTIHGLQAVNHRSYINFKNDNWFYTEDVIVRFNKIYDVYNGPNEYASPGDAIRISGEGKNRLVYGNYCRGSGINLNWNWSADNDGVGGEGYFVWGNIVDQTTRGGGISISGTSLNSDIFKNFYIFNNTIYRAVLDDQNGSYFYAISDSIGNVPAITNGSIHVKNNIIADTRPNASEHIGISLTSHAELKIDYNHHSIAGMTPKVAFYGSGCNPCDWNSEERPYNHGINDTQGDPLFVDTVSGNMALQAGSPAINTGADLSAYDSVLPTLMIQGVSYTFSFATALDPEATNWAVVPPQVVTVDQNNYGQWEKGAYAFTKKTDTLPVPNNLKFK